MKRVLCLILCLSALSLVAVEGMAQELNAEKLEAIAAAVPQDSQAEPQAPRKILVFGLTLGFRHGSIPYISEAIRRMGEKTGAYEAVVSDDIAMFEPDTINGFDAIVMNNPTGDIFKASNLDELNEEEKAKAVEREQRLKKSLLDFVSGGKGLMGIHAATDCCYNWAEYGEMIGGYFDGHPWSEEVTIKVEAPDHPTVESFGKEDFVIHEEIYQMKAPYSRENLHILLSLNTSEINMEKKGIKRKDHDFAVAWVTDYGQGRVFYTSIGHNIDLLTDTRILRHYLDGIQFAIGDLDGDTTPSKEITQDGWKQMFNGKDLTGWMTDKPNAWIVEGDALSRNGGGYLWSADQYEDFVLSLEFNYAKGANSGIFFRTANPADCVQTGFEMQILDSYGKEEVGKHDCGSLYDAKAPSVNACKAPGEWNHAVLTCDGSRIKIEINGVEVVDADLNNWTEPHQNPDGTKNKYRTAYKDMARKGHIGFQDHGDPILYRNVKIKELD